MTLPLWPSCTIHSSSCVHFTQAHALPVCLTFNAFNAWKVLLDPLPLFRQKHNKATQLQGKCVSIFTCTHSDDSLAEAERTPAAVLSLVLRFVVAQGVVFQDDPAVLPSMDIICPLEMQKVAKLMPLYDNRIQSSVTSTFLHDKTENASSNLCPCKTTSYTCLC